tara:strand:- start:61 stop:267 length:207 start_codon:yes stop_codon:yes gene_type:complete
MNESEYMQQQDDHNYCRLEDHKRQEEEELDCLKNDSKRLDDSKELAIKTVVAYRPNEAMKRAQVLNLK